MREREGGEMEEECLVGEGRRGDGGGGVFSGRGKEGRWRRSV